MVQLLDNNGYVGSSMARTKATLSANYNHFLFILQTGVRSSELRGLIWDDIDFQNHIIHIRRNVTHDSNNNRFITGEFNRKKWNLY